MQFGNQGKEVTDGVCDVPTEEGFTLVFCPVPTSGSSGLHHHQSTLTESQPDKHSPSGGEPGLASKGTRGHVLLSKPIKW